MAIPAHLESAPPSESRRGPPRRRIRLPSHAKDADLDANVMIHTISATGLLVETDLALGIGDRLEIGLPHARAPATEVIWASGRLYDRTCVVLGKRVDVRVVPVVQRSLNKK